MLYLLTASVLLFPNCLFFILTVVLIFPGFFDLPVHFKGPGFFYGRGPEKNIFDAVGIETARLILYTYIVKSGITD